MPPSQGGSQTPRRHHVVSLEHKGVYPVEESSSCSVPSRGHSSSVSTRLHGATVRVAQCGSGPGPPPGRHHNDPVPSVTPRPSLSTVPVAALTYKCTRDQWTVYCRVIREKNLCQDMRWYQRCCQTCRDFYANKMRRPLPPPSPSS